MSIGAVVVSHDSAEDLPACLEALRSAVDLERVMVVDNQSQDGSREVVQRFKDPRISLVVEVCWMLRTLCLMITLFKMMEKAVA